MSAPSYAVSHTETARRAALRLGPAAESVFRRAADGDLRALDALRRVMAEDTHAQADGDYS